MSAVSEACRLSALNIGSHIKVMGGETDNDVMFAGELVAFSAFKPFSERAGQSITVSVRNGKLHLTQTVPGDTIVLIGGAA